LVSLSSPYVHDARSQEPKICQKYLVLYMKTNKHFFLNQMLPISS